MGESQIYMGKKTVLVRQMFGEDKDIERHIALQFDNRGLAKITGRFEQYKKQMYKILEKFDKWQSTNAMNLSQINGRNSKSISEVERTPTI